MELVMSILLLLAATLISGEVCTSPSVSTSTYTSKNIALSTETAYVAEFSVTCKEEDVTNLNLFAEINAGQLVPVSMVPDRNVYQISWAQPHKEATTGIISVKVFNEEGYAAYRKVQRNKEDTAKVESLFTVQVSHPGVSREGLFVQTEFIAVVCALLIWWTANSMRSQIME